jgi:hypothetical protein
MLTPWVNVRKPFVLSLSKHERLSQVPTAVFRIRLGYDTDRSTNYIP